jgi:hypothetical protein
MFFSPHGATAPSKAGPLRHPDFAIALKTHHTRLESSGQVISPTQRPEPDNTQRSRQASMPPTVFEPANSASQQQQTQV